MNINKNKLDSMKNNELLLTKKKGKIKFKILFHEQNLL